MIANDAADGQMKTDPTRVAFLLLAVLALVGCQDDRPSNGASSVAESSVNALQPNVTCAVPALVMADNAQLVSALMNETKANFAAAYGSACRKGLLAGKPLIDSKAAEHKLFLVNAPEANVASIYLSEIDGNRMVLEYPFLTGDGQTQVPSTDELEEAIYCVVHGATPEEQESSGRCLVD